MTTPPPVTELNLTDEIKQVVNGALANGTPVMLAYVDEEGQPSLSFRGSTQAYSENQLAIWVRNPEGGLLRSLAKNTRVTLLYRDPQTRTMLQFRGRGHVETADSVRKTVYGNSPEPERNLDREQKGMPLVIDLHRVDGFMSGARFQMRRP